MAKTKPFVPKTVTFKGGKTVTFQRPISKRRSAQKGK